MIHFATVHFLDDRWVDVQLRTRFVYGRIPENDEFAAELFL